MKFKRAGFLTKIVVLVLLIYMATSLLDLRGKIQDIRIEQEELDRKVTVQQMENQELSDAIAHKDDPEMMEEVARDKGLVKENEELYIDVAN